MKAAPRALVRIGWIPALVLLVLAAFATSWLAPSSHGLEETGDHALASFAGAAGELGYRVETTLLSPVAAGGHTAARTLLVLPEARSPYSAAEADALAAWVEGGGRLLVASSSEGVAPVVERFGVHLGAQRVFDATLGGEPGEVPATARLDETPRRIVLTRPRALSPLVEDGSLRAVAQTGNGSFLDLDGNGRLDTSDTRGPFIVGMAAAEGRVLVLATPLLLTNAGLERAENALFAGDVLAGLLPEGGSVVLDVSHAPHGPTSGFVVTTARLPLVWAQVPLVGGILIVLSTLLVAGIVWRHVRAPGSWLAYDHDPRAERAGPEVPLDRAMVRERLARLAAETRGRGSARASRARDELSARLGAAGTEEGAA